MLNTKLRRFDLHKWSAIFRGNLTILLLQRFLLNRTSSIFYKNRLIRSIKQERTKNTYWPKTNRTWLSSFHTFQLKSKKIARTEPRLAVTWKLALGANASSVILGYKFLRVSKITSHFFANIRPKRLITKCYAFVGISHKHML